METKETKRRKFYEIEEIENYEEIKEEVIQKIAFTEQDWECRRSISETKWYDFNDFLWIVINVNYGLFNSIQDIVDDINQCYEMM